MRLPMPSPSGFEFYRRLSAEGHGDSGCDAIKSAMRFGTELGRSGHARLIRVECECEYYEQVRGWRPLHTCSYPRSYVSYALSGSLLVLGTIETIENPMVIRTRSQVSKMFVKRQVVSHAGDPLDVEHARW